MLGSRRRAGRLAVRPVALAVAVVLCSSWSAVAAPLGQITEFSLPSNETIVGSGIAAGVDGNVWYTSNNLIARITPAGKIKDVWRGGIDVVPAITAGPDGNMWFADTVGAIGRVTESGQVTKFTNGLQPGSADNASSPSDIVAGPGGKLWFTDPGARAIGAITTSGAISEFSSGLSPNAVPNSIAAGPDGNLWFTDRACVQNSGAVCAIGRATPSGAITEFPLSAGSDPTDIAAGPDGNVWFLVNTTTGRAIAVGRITPSGQITEFSAGLRPNQGSSLYAIARGPDGNLWFTDDGTVQATGQAIGRITPSGEITEYSNGLRSKGTGLTDITSGPDGNMWFLGRGFAIGQIGTGSASGSTPALGTTVNVKPISGQVLVKAPGQQFLPLSATSAIPAGSDIDARRGSLKLTAAAARKGRTQSATLSGGYFEVTQVAKGKNKGLTNLTLVEGGSAGAPSRASCRVHGALEPNGPSASAAASRRVLQTLHARGHGSFSTRGGSASATSRGTAWTISDRCDGTLITVQKDTVVVRDFVRHKTLTLRAGQRYLAKR